MNNPRSDTADHQREVNEIPPPKPRHRQIANLLKKLYPDGGSVLEVGAGNGELANLLAKNYDYIGFEPAAGLANWALNSDRVRIVKRLFSRSQVDAPVDAIVLDNVIEHLADPKSLIDECVVCLKPGGRMFVIVPNRYDWRRLSGKWRRTRHYVAPDHINYFSLSDLKRLASDIGCRLEFFGFSAVRGSGSRKFYARAVFESMGLSVFGHNLIFCRRS